MESFQWFAGFGVFGGKSEEKIHKTLKLIKMAYYPTPEEEYELMYGEELELMNEQDGSDNKSVLIIKILIIIFLRSRRKYCQKSRQSKD